MVNDDQTDLYYPAQSLDAVLQPLRLPGYQGDGDIRLWVVRGDQIHPQISGNKWYKLKYNLQIARHAGVRAIVSFGGAWSNHIHALAAAGNLVNIPTIGVIRGTWRRQLTATLKDAETWGMKLVFVDKDQYRNRSDTGWIASKLPEWVKQAGLQSLPKSMNRAAACAKLFTQQNHSGHDLMPESFNPLMIDEMLVIPEGGSNDAGVAGVRDWARAIYARLEDKTTIILPVGSGGTLAGFASEPSPHQLVGIPVVKAGELLHSQIAAMLAGQDIQDRAKSAATSWYLKTGYEFGGYGRYPDALKAFANSLEADAELPLDPVYNAKAFYGLSDMLTRQDITTGQVVIIHTGGLQGKRGFA